MRLIDVDALKKELRMADRCEDCERNARDCQYVYGHTRMDICEMLDDAPTVGGWISTKDRLPEREGLYLCWSAINGGYACYQIHLWKGGRWYWVHDVRYWMTLPEPPEEVQE